ncbi:protein rep, partial [Staphylococcus aureus]|uniref:protein rep n=1 Tax=Staphylococcus aureus TaxID=1280 RepID=UPI002897F56E
WMRSLKNSYQSYRVIEELLNEKPKARWLFLTLSTRNAIDVDHLEQSLKNMSKAFNKLKMYKKVKKNIIGFLRSTDVTVNKNDG